MSIVARQLWPGSLRAACKKLALQHQASMCALDTKAKQDADLHAISLPCSTMHRCVLSTPRQSKMLTCMQEACLAAPGIDVCFRHQGKARCCLACKKHALQHQASRSATRLLRCFQRRQHEGGACAMTQVDTDVEGNLHFAKRSSQEHG